MPMDSAPSPLRVMTKAWDEMTGWNFGTSGNHWTGTHFLTATITRLARVGGRQPFERNECDPCAGYLIIL